MKGLKYQKTLVKTLSKDKGDIEREFVPAYFGSNAMAIINDEDFDVILDHSFQVIFNKIDHWISAKSDWVNELVDGDYINIFVYSPLSGRCYIQLPEDLRSSKKDLIKIKNDDDNKYFLQCQVRHLNQVDKNPQRIAKLDRRIAYSLDYCFKFSVSKKDYGKTEVMNNISINMFACESG